MGNKNEENQNDSLFIEIVILIVVLVLLRISYLIHKVTRNASLKVPERRTKPVKTLIVIGSGGHTTEMLNLLETISVKNYSPRVYVVASSDTTSKKKVDELEQKLNSDYKIMYVPRSRTVNQSYVSSVFTTLYAFLYSLPLVFCVRPDLILCNGPGTCIPVCIASFLLRCMFILDSKVMFIESFCRTKSLSLTGGILMYFADHVLVQWPQLKKKHARVEFIGQLV